MTTLDDNPDKQSVLRFISEASNYGNLGVFVGAGFSKAVLNHGVEDIALSWGQILEKACDRLEVPYDEISKEGYGYPEIATSICERYAEVKEVDYQEAVSELKSALAALTAWYPQQNYRERYSNYVNRLDPDWIITTNYDLVLESLLTGKCVPLNPNDSMSSPSGMVPIYHLHGIRSNPDTIIITQEDYVRLFRPNEYRQIKLALTMKESSVLLIGYGLGDVNVLTALDWSRNVFSTHSESYPNDVIQIVRKENPSEHPYRDKNGIVILEFNSLDNFFDEFIVQDDAFQAEMAGDKEALDHLVGELNEPDQDLVNRFIDDAEFRTLILGLLARFPSEVILSFVSFLNRCLDETWRRAQPDGAFYAYNENLIVLLDILTTLGVDQIPPALLESLAYNLNRVANYVGGARGESWEANDTFQARKGELSAELVKELRAIAEQHWYFQLKSLLDRI